MGNTPVWPQQKHFITLRQTGPDDVNVVGPPAFPYLRGQHAVIIIQKPLLASQKPKPTTEQLEQSLA